MAQPQETKYAHGHHATVLKSHLWRTKENSAAYLLPYMKPAMKVLDVGCGPGNLTCDLATMVPQGSIIGIDRSEDVIQKANALASERGQSDRVTFEAGDVFNMPFEDNTFNIVHSHQVLQHVGDASKALTEMKRVLKPGGIVAARDMTHFLFWPEQKELTEFVDLFWKIAEKTGGQPGTGAMLRKFAREGGFEAEKVTITGSTWTFANEDDLEFWCGELIIQIACVHADEKGMWADRVLQSEFKSNALKYGLATEEDLQRISKAFRDFITTQDAWFTVVNGELIAQK
jgi:SAM-dependent methyltransferase